MDDGWVLFQQRSDGVRWVGCVIKGSLRILDTFLRFDAKIIK